MTLPTLIDLAKKSPTRRELCCPICAGEIRLVAYPIHVCLKCGGEFKSLFELAVASGGR